MGMIAKFEIKCRNCGERFYVPFGEEEARKYCKKCKERHGLEDCSEESTMEEL